jgi:hypothetical protein
MPDFASPSFGGFAFIGCLAVLTQFSFRPMTLRRRVSPVLLFSEQFYYCTKKAKFQSLSCSKNRHPAEADRRSDF